MDNDGYPRPGFLTPAQRRTLEAVCETFCPALEPPPGTPLEGPPAAYWRRGATVLGVAAVIEARLVEETTPAEQAEFAQGMDALENPAVCRLTSGQATPFSRRGPAAREGLLRAWAVSPLPPIRKAYQTFKRLASFHFYTAPAPGGGPNPNHAALGYPDPWRPPARPAPPANPAHPLRPLTITADTVLEADACVVGSGAGGGIVAALLAAAGYRVVVLEAGTGRAEAAFTGDELDGFRQLYARGGLLISEDGAVALLAGRTLGGGTTINWMTCFRPPRGVLEAWAASCGVHELLGPELQTSLDAVERRLQVNAAESRLNPNNAALVRGATALGWHHALQARNARGCGDCGHCTFGCPWGAKQGTLRTYLQDACDAGARIVTCATAERVLVAAGRVVGVEARSGPPRPRPAHAAQPGGYRLSVRAPLVVVAGGAIQSPALLLRSGLRQPALGRNLYLHPATVMIARFDHDIAGWSGPLQTAHSDEFADLDGAGYGFKFETTPVYPGLAAAAAPWDSGAGFKRLMLAIKQAASLLVLVRDRDTGHIALDRWGNPRIHYHLGAHDARHLLRGCKEGARLLLAAGAREVFTLHTRTTRILRTGAAEPSPEAWARFDAAVDRQGAGPNRLGVFSAHQMGTCRMGADPATSVVDSTGAVYGVRGLYVADGSIFPLSSGVNPMITIMGLAHWIGRRLAAQPPSR
jgi:choline dehydrogenase-like flavoprotein